MQYRQAYLRSAGVFWVVAVIVLLVAADIAAQASIRMRVAREQGHPADTLFVGKPGRVWIELVNAPVDSVDGIVTVFLMSRLGGGSSNWQALDANSWNWHGTYGTYEERGFNQLMQDGISPDSGLMYCHVISTLPSTTSDSLIATMSLITEDTGTIVFDTATIDTGMVHNITAVVLRDAGFMSVENSLSYEFRPVSIIGCRSPTVLPQSLDTTIVLQDTMTLCVDLVTDLEFDVSVSHGEWENDQLCVFLDTVGRYEVEATSWNQCDTVTALINITVQAGCCLGETGDVNADGNLNLTDVTLLVNHLFVIFQPLVCPAEANTNADSNCVRNLTDLTLLVNRLFVTFQPLADCDDFDQSVCGSS